MHTADIAASLSKIQLKPGPHRSPDYGLCVMECVAFVAGERHTDRPECACPVITQIAVHANDTVPPAVLAQMSSRVLRLAGSRGSEDLMAKRASFLVDYVVRKAMPAALAASALPACAELAKEFADLPPIVSPRHTLLARMLAGTIPYDAKPGAAQSLSGLRAGTTLEGMLDALRNGIYRQSTNRVIDILDELGDPVDYLALLDGMLDIGETPALEVTDAVAARIATLAS